MIICGINASDRCLHFEEHILILFVRLGVYLLRELYYRLEMGIMLFFLYEEVRMSLRLTEGKSSAIFCIDARYAFS